MASKASHKIFAVMKQLFPDLPNGITKLTLTLDVDAAPVIECQYIVKTLGFVTQEHDTFHISDDGSGDSCEPA